MLVEEAGKLWVGVEVVVLWVRFFGVGIVVVGVEKEESMN